MQGEKYVARKPVTQLFYCQAVIVKFKSKWMVHKRDSRSFDSGLFYSPLTSRNIVWVLPFAMWLQPQYNLNTRRTPPTWPLTQVTWLSERFVVSRVDLYSPHLLLDNVLTMHRCWSVLGIERWKEYSPNCLGVADLNIIKILGNPQCGITNMRDEQTW